jgi:hypothetical protein
MIRILIDKIIKFPFCSLFTTQKEKEQVQPLVITTDLIIPPIKQNTKPLPMRYISSLHIVDKRGNTLSWDTEINHKYKLSPYIAFYKWFFTKTTPYFTLKFKDGETTLLRKQIVRFTVSIRRRI